MPNYGPVPAGGGFDASGNPFMTVGGRQVSVPMQFGFPRWNEAYDIYHNPSAASARYAQIGQAPPMSNPDSPIGGGGVSIPTIPSAGGGSASQLPWTGGNTGWQNVVHPAIVGSGATAPPSAAPGQAISNIVPESVSDTSGSGGTFQPGASPNLESLTQMINQLNLQAQQAANAGRVPGSAGIENILSGNTAQLAQGNLPADVVRNIQQQAAERGVSTGNDNYLQALGLNSLQAQQTAQGNLSAADARNPVAPIFDPTSQLLTPAQAGQLNTEQAQLALEWYKALHPNLTGGGGGGRGGGTPPGGSDSSLPSWFPTIGGTPSSSSVTPPPSLFAPPDETSSLYPGTGVPGLPDLGSILGPQDPGYGLSPDPYGQAPYGLDLSNPDLWNLDNSSIFGGGGQDPFYQYGG